MKTNQEQTKLTALELEKIQSIQTQQQELNELKLQVGDYATLYELAKQQSVNKQLELSQQSEALKNQLVSKYGEGFSITEDGTVITKVETKVETPGSIQEEEVVK